MYIYIGNRDAGLYGEAITSDFILTEAANFLFKKVGRADALEAGRTMMEGYKIVHVDEMLFTEAWNRFAELKPFSLTDCTNLAVIENYGIDTLFTFDSAFKNFVKTVGI